MGPIDLILRSQGGDDENAHIVVDRSPFRVGRRPDNDAQVVAPDISGTHAILRCEADGWWVDDNGSTNGTFVNGHRLTKGTALKIGDILHFATRGYIVTSDTSEVRVNIATQVLSDSNDIRKSMDLIKIVEENRTYPFFQPIVDLRTNKTVGWEALGRAAMSSGISDVGLMFWLAKQNNLEVKLSQAFRDSTALCASCRHCWSQGAPVGSYLFVNVHPLEIQINSFLPSLRQLAESDLKEYYRIVIEMPESWVCNTQEMQKWVKEIRDLGMLVAYDDFGAGQSRIPDLINVPPDMLKLDRELIASVDGHRVKRHLVKAIVDSCRELNVVTLGECIETQDELHACIDMGIDLGQGYLLGRPKPAYDLFNANKASLPIDICPFVRFDMLPRVL